MHMCNFFGGDRNNKLDKDTQCHIANPNAARSKTVGLLLFNTYCFHGYTHITIHAYLAIYFVSYELKTNAPGKAGPISFIPYLNL